MMNSILDDIYTTQKQLDEEAHHSLKEYVENTHRHVQDLAKTYGFTLQYETRIGGYEIISPIPSTSKELSTSEDKESLREA